MNSSSESEPVFVAESQANEDYPLSAVPAEVRKSFWSLAPLLMGFTLFTGTMFAGGLLGSAYRFFPDLVGLIILGSLILGVYAAALGYIASQSGLSTLLMARFSFGNLGSRWVDFLLGFTQIGWYAWGAALMAKLLQELAGVPPSLNWLTILVFTYLFASTAYIGYRGMDWLSRLAVPAIIVLMIWCLVLAGGKVGGWEGLLAIAPTKPLPLGAALTLIVGTFISGGTQATNWSRFAKSGNVAVTSTLAAFGLINGFVIFAGAFCALVYGKDDMVLVMKEQGLLVWGLILLFLTLWTTMDNGIYAFSLAGAHMFRTNRRHLLVLGGATVALVLAWGGIYEQLVPYLILLGTFIPPVGGIIMSDYWLHRRGQFPPLSQQQPAFNWAGIIAYVLASAIAFFLPGIKPINGIIAAVIFYFVLAKFMPPTPEDEGVRE